jgi:3-hydroxyisobutyrate dehydrogenase
MTSVAHIEQSEKLGFVGLGMMGFPMSRRLLDGGYDVTVWNRSAAKAVIDAGAKLAPDPRAVAAAVSSHFHVRTMRTPSFGFRMAS